MKDLPASMSEYITMLFECKEDTDIGYPKLECINGTCKNACDMVNDSGAEKYGDVWNKIVSFYQFETVLESYFKKEGEKRFFTRTARKDYKDKTLKEVYQLFLDCARGYLTHRYLLYNGRYI